MTRGRRLLLLQLVLWPALALAAEGAYRAWLHLGEQPYDPTAARTTLRRIASGMTRTVPEDGTAEAPALVGGRVPARLHPYVGFVPRPFPEKLRRELARYSAPPAADELRVLVVGGSVAGNFARRGAEALAAALAEVPALRGRRARLVNYGLGAHKQPQQLLLASYLLIQGLRVDAVLNLDGFNEVALASYNAEHGAHPTYPSLAHWGHLTLSAADDPVAGELVRALRAEQARVAAIAEQDARWHLTVSALLGRWTLGRARAAQRHYAEVYERYTDHLASRGAGEGARGHGFERGRALELAVDTWRRSSLLLHELCAASGIGYLHVLQPTLHDEGAKPATAEERARGSADPSWIRGARDGYPRLREAGRELAARGVAFLDASRVFADVPETLYYDVCHFETPGHERLAREVAPALAEALAR